jgi:hypothetical protein
MVASSKEDRVAHALLHASFLSHLITHLLPLVLSVLPLSRKKVIREFKICPAKKVALGPI